MTETEPLFYSQLSVFCSFFAILILHVGDLKFDSSDSSDGRSSSIRNFVMSKSAKLGVLLFLTISLFFDGFYENNLLTVGAPYNLEKTNVNIRIYHFVFVSKVGCTLLCWLFQFSYWMGQSEQDLMTDLPTGYNQERAVVSVDLPDIGEIEKQLTDALQPEPNKSASDRVMAEEVHATTPITNNVVLVLACVFVSWMHFAFMFAEAQMLTPNTKMTDSNIVAISANAICLFSSLMLVVLDAVKNGKHHVGLKYKNIFGIGNMEMGLSGGQFWIYWPPLAIMSFELLALSAWTQVYVGFDHMLLYLAFRVLCYVLVSNSTSCATWVQVNLYVTLLFLQSITFMVTTGGYHMDLGAKSNNTLSGPNVHYAMMMYFENADLHLRSYASNYTLLYDSTTQGNLAISCSAMILSGLTLLSAGLRCVGM